MWIAYNCKKDAWTWNIDAGGKTSCECELDIAKDWKDDGWYVWLFFFDPIKNLFSRSYSIHVPEAIDHAQMDIDLRFVSHQSIRESKIMHYWLESRKFTGRERRIYLEEYEDDMNGDRGKSEKKQI